MLISWNLHLACTVISLSNFVSEGYEGLIEEKHLENIIILVTQGLNFLLKLQEFIKIICLSNVADNDNFHVVLLEKNERI